SGYANYTYHENEKNLLVASGTFITPYKIGIFRLMRKLNDTCFEPKIRIRKIQPDGILIPIDVEFQFPVINACTGLIPYYNNEVVLRAIIINEKFMLIVYFKSIESSPVKYTLFAAIADERVIAPNIDSDQGFLIYMRAQNMSISAWSLLSPPNSRGEINRIVYGNFANNNYTVGCLFQMVDGGFGFIASSQVVESQNLTGMRTLVEPKWKVSIRFLRPGAKEFTEPYLLYQTIADLDNILIRPCNAAFDGQGYQCILQMIKNDNQTSQGIYIKITFLSTGTLIKIDRLTDIIGSNSVTDLLALRYAKIYDSDEKYNDTWEFPVNTTIATQPIVLYSNKIYLVSNLNEQGDYTILSTDVTKFMSADNGYQNPNIVSTNPSINAIIPTNTTDITVTYTEKINVSSRSVAIYQIYGNNSILRQKTSGQSLFCYSINEYTVGIKILRSTFNQPGASYYVVVDSDFVKTRKFNEALTGIEAYVWKFNSTQKTEKYAASAIGLLRLTLEGTNLYLNLSSDEKRDFLNYLKEDIAQVIPINSNRIDISHRVGYDYSAKQPQLLLRLQVNSNNDLSSRNVKEIILDLNDLILNKKITGISLYNYTNFLDEEYGFKQIHLLLDVLWIIRNGHDVPWLFLPSLIFLLAPICFNGLLAFTLVIYEASQNNAFHKWLHKYTTIASVFTLLASADVEALTILCSKLAGLEAFSVQFMQTTESWIFFARCVNLFIEDVPQFTIQYRVAADNINDSFAQCKVGNFYRFDEGTEVNYESAFSYHQKSASLLSWSLLRKNMRYKSNSKQAFELYKSSASPTVIIVDMEHGEIFFWYFLAAEEDNDRAKIAIGYCFRNGLGLVRNIYVSIKWFQEPIETLKDQIKLLYVLVVYLTSWVKS
ncbi:7460_t:CDS:10, partial [Ambispora gerdemannii]